MTENLNSLSAKWSTNKKIIFRFCFIYFFLLIAPWTWLYDVPGLSLLIGYYNDFIEWVVKGFNHQFFRFPISAVVNNGSGDTSFGWEEIFTYQILAFAGMLIWTKLDRKRRNYEKADYWLRTFLRYFLIMNCMIYGIDKLYALQMPFPGISQLATPLGDLLPMRFSWLFIGYSTPYEMFSGAMELLAGLLLLNRKTITLGLFIATAVFTNVMMLNLCYDIPVKIFSIHLVIYCLYLLSADAGRLYQFLVLNKPVPSKLIDQIDLPKKWMRITRIVFKTIFIIVFVLLPFYTTWGFYENFNKASNTKPINPGLYDVAVFAVNKDTLPPVLTDTIRWRDIVFEKNGTGSVGSTDTSFRQRYRRGYFSFSTDTIKQTLGIKVKSSDSNFLYSFHYELTDSSTIKLKGVRTRDSIYLVLKRSKRHFQLAEKQFHWISEANR